MKTPLGYDMHEAVAKIAQGDAATANGLMWALSRWFDEVSQRPLVNVHRRTLDDTWRQVIRYFGGEAALKLIAAPHDELVATYRSAAPLVEQLRSVPRDAVLRIDTPNALGCMDTRSIPLGRLCHEAADALGEQG